MTAPRPKLKRLVFTAVDLKAIKIRAGAPKGARGGDSYVRPKPVIRGLSE